MENQEQLYHFYYQTEYNNKIKLSPFSISDNHLCNSKNQGNKMNHTRSISIDMSCVPTTPSVSLSQSKSYIDLSDGESTPLMYGSSNLKKTAITNRRGMWLLIYIIFYFGFLSAGSLIFCAFERNISLQQQQNVLNVRQRFLTKYSNILDEDLEEFIEDFIKINGHGVSALRNATADLNWSFGQALFFSATIITTIGYGHVTPLSAAGKIFCIIYAIIGIPLTLVLISAVVERLLVPTNWMLGKLNSKLGHLYQPLSIRLLHLAIIAITFGLIFFVFPTIIFSHLEPNWTILDAFYYCFISLTTIGLGDFVPGDGVDQSNQSLYKVSITVYLIFGIIGMMLTLTIFYEIPQLNLGQLFTENSFDDTEKVRLSQNNAPFYSGPSGLLYIPQRDDEVRRSVVRIRPHGDDSPSPDDPTPMHAKDIRVP